MCFFVISNDVRKDHTDDPVINKDNFSDDIAQWKLDKKALLTLKTAVDKEDYDLRNTKVMTLQEIKEATDKLIKEREILVEVVKRRKALVKKEAELKEYELKRTTLKRKTEQKVQEWYNSKKPGFRELALLEDIIADEGGQTSCSVCTTDFTPLLLISPDAMKDVTTNCIGCGYFSCYKCVVRMLEVNAIHDRSIGYKCPQCKLFNCNKVNACYDERRWDILSTSIPFASGISTHKKPHPFGQMLETSDSQVITHEANMQRQQIHNESYLVHQEEEEEQEDVNINAPTSPQYNPTSPLYFPTSPQYSPHSPILRSPDLTEIWHPSNAPVQNQYGSNSNLSFV